MLNTVITFETEVPTVEQMVERIEAARVLREWLVLDLVAAASARALMSS